MLLSTCWAVVRPWRAKFSARIEVSGSAVSAASRRIELPVISTRCIGALSSAWASAPAAWAASSAAAMGKRMRGVIGFLP
jgi:hypothetical protein